MLLTAGLGGVLVAAMALPVVAASGILVRNTADKVTATTLSVTTLPQRSAIYDRSGNLMTYVYNVDEGTAGTYSGVDRQPVDYDQISPYMTQAVVAIEDDRYWTHGAIDFQGTLRAVVNDAEGKDVQGGSSIAQQYVKGVLVLAALGNPQAEQQAIAGNLSRKYTELRMALDVAHKMSKQDILAGYLNDDYFSNSAYGIEAAAEIYFGEDARQLSLTQAALLAGIVENPTAYDPIRFPQVALTRRNTVIARMVETRVLSAAVGARAEKLPLGLHVHTAQTGCQASTIAARNYGFFCDYVMHDLLLDKQLGATPNDRAKALATGGMKIYTTVSPQDESAATNAVNYVLPQFSNKYNPKGNAATEALITPGTGQIMAVAEDRPYGTGHNQTVLDYAVGSQYGGINGVQTGSSSKVFTLVTALEEHYRFGYTATVKNNATITGFTNCAGDAAGYDTTTQQPGAWTVFNASQSDQGAYSLYTGTTDSINTFYAQLEQKVGLCNVVKTAMAMGVTRADGRSLMQSDGPNQASADNTPSFTLGSINVSPLSMAAAYATVADQGIYCTPVAILSMTDVNGKKLPVPSANCHRVMDAGVANAANYILQGVLTVGTAGTLGGIQGYEAAGKTGTSNVGSGNGTPYAAFAGYTTNLASFTSVFNPSSPTTDTMTGPSACYHSVVYQGPYCPSEMFGADAPGNTWLKTFRDANLGHSRYWPTPPSSFYSQGDGTHVVQPPKPGQKNGKGGGNGGNNGGGTGTTGTGGNGGGTGGTGGGGGGTGGTGGTGGGGGNGGGGNGGPPAR
ncbi:MAG TPA: transglycosylase domain-containing protein [Trebonia sp.]|nr:transglycosylase domain-containing protein [Trebonia sp.]